MNNVLVQVFEQYDRLVPTDWLRIVAVNTLAVEGSDSSVTVSVVIADDQTVARLNADYRGLEETTDVLSFSNVHSGQFYGSTSPPETDATGFVLPPGHQEGLGEVIVSYPQALRQATEACRSIETELASLIAHGILHLLGYDHEEEAEAAQMRRMERATLESLSSNGVLP